MLEAMLGASAFVWLLDRAISGAIGNRTDAGVVSVYRGIAKRINDGKIVNSDMQKSVHRSFISALKSICEDCLDDIRRIKYEQLGNFYWLESEKWLEKKKQDFENELKVVNKAEYIEPPIESLKEIELLLIPAGDLGGNRFQTVNRKLIEVAIGGNEPPECYKISLENTLFERMCGYFAYEIKNNQVVHNIFDVQLLAQIDIKVENIVDSLLVVAKDVPQLLEKMDRIDNGIKGIVQTLEKIPISLQHFMTLDAFLDSSIPRYWPKRKDVEDGMLYLPEGYIKEIEKKLLEKGRCLLTGVSASGKTVLAITFGLLWRDDVKLKGKHSEAVVFYLDASIGYSTEKGEDWYREVLAHDYQNELFIIDNCHLGTEAVNAFCDQWERKRPKHAAVLFISAPKVSESPWEEEPEDYFESFEQAEAMVSIQPEQIYKGILQTYSDTYRRIDPQRFIPVEKDLSDPYCAEKLERLCAHNLTAARSILEAWSDIGGRLSDITEEFALSGIARRHLTHNKAPALAPLCSLGQFEIPVHDNFIRQLSQESVNALRKENLIVPEDSPLYGRCHRVSFHPQVAALIFRAYLYQQIRSGFEKRIDDEIFKFLKNYLSNCPENFIVVYYRLYRVGASELQNRLLCDAKLQTCATKQSTTRPLNEFFQYLYALYKIHPDQAKNLLQGFVNQITAEKLQKEVLALTGKQFYIVTFFLTKINPDLSLQVLGKLPANLVFDRIRFSNLSCIASWIKPTSSSIAVKLGYSVAWCQQIAKMFDLDDLVVMAQKENPQALAWFIDAFIDIDIEWAKLFVDKLSPETLGKKFSGQPLSVIDHILRLMKRLEYDPAFYERFIDMLDRKTLLVRVQDTGLQQLYWVLRNSNDIAPELAKSLLAYITPEGLAEMLKKQQGTAQNVMDLSRVSDLQFKREFLQHIDDEEIVAIFERSNLGAIGSLIERQFRRFEQPYSIFAAQSLHNLLATQRISEISKFIHRVQRVPTQGQRLTVQALELLLKTDLSHRVIESDVEHLSILLLNADSVNPNYPSRILSALAPSGAVEKALQHSGIHGIQLLLRNLSEMAPEFLLRISKSLQTLDLSDQIKEAEIKDLGYFLWNIRAYLGAELAQSYCRIVDSKLHSEQIANANLTDLGSFLWNLVHISDMEELKALDMPVLKERLCKEWETNPGQCLSILGIILVTSPEATTYSNLSALDIERVSGKLTVWLTKNLNEGHSYIFALTVKSLQVLDERQTIKIVRNSLFKESIMDTRILSYFGRRWHKQ